MNTRKYYFSICPVCNEPIETRITKTREADGKPVHEECYAQAVKTEQPKRAA